MPAGLSRYGTARGNTAIRSGSRPLIASLSCGSADPRTIVTAMITRMMPPAIDSDPVEKWSSLANNFAEADQEHRDHAGGGEHLAHHQPLGRHVNRGGDLQERHERDLRPDADEQQQEGVDHQVDIDRRVIHHCSSPRCERRMQIAPRTDLPGDHIDRRAPTPAPATLQVAPHVGIFRDSSVPKVCYGVANRGHRSHTNPSGMRTNGGVSVERRCTSASDREAQRRPRRSGDRVRDAATDGRGGSARSPNG